MLSLLLLALFFAATAVTATAQPQESLKFRHFSVRQGLSDGHVTALAQDSRGYLWVGTRNGLNRYNGYNFKVFQNDPANDNTIVGNNIQCLYIDSVGNIWAGLVGGQVSCYNPKEETFRNYNCYFSQSEADGDVSAITEEGGYMWVTVDRRGLVRLNPENGEIVRYEHNPDNPASLSHNAVTGIARGPNGKLWVSSWGGGLDLFDPQTGTFTHYGYPGANDVRYNQIKALLLDSEGNIWLGSTYLGVFFMGTENEHWKHFPGGSDWGMAGNSVITMAEDRQSNIWVGFASGLSVYNKEAGSFSTIQINDGEYGLHSMEISSLLASSDGSLWVGTSNGLHLYNPSLIQFGCLVIPGEGTLADYSQAILKDTKGNLWVRTEEGLFFYKKQKAGYSPGRLLDDARVYNVGLALYEDSASNVWFGNNGSFVQKYNLESGRTSEIKLPIRTTKVFYEDSDGTIWIGTELGLCSYDPESGKVHPPLFSSGELIFPADKAAAVLRDTNGNLWVGTEGGLKRYGASEKLIRVYTTSDGSSLGSLDITALYQDRSDNIWVGTASGLEKYDKATDSFILIRRPGDQAGFSVMGIVEDDEGDLWITSSSGLIRYRPAEGSLYVFDEDDGLPSRVFVRGAISRSSDGEILAGTVAGPIRFYPENIRLGKTVPLALIEDFQVSSKHFVPGPGPVKLSHRQSTLSFQFASVDYLNPGKIHYAYRMTGVDDAWIYTGPENRQATFANLPPGSYVFEVKALDDNNNSGESARMEIVIRPPFYRTILAYIIYALLFVAAIAELILWLRRRNAREIERMKAAQQHEMDELKFKFFTNISHEFRTSLTLIMGPLEHLRKNEKADGHDLMEIMARSSERLRRLVNQLLDFRKVDAGKMEVHNSTQDLIPFLKELFDTYSYYAGEKELEYTFISDVDSLVFDFDKDKLDKMVYNLLSNAFKYTDRGGKVSIHVSPGHGQVRISVTDTGVGISEEEAKDLFVRFYQATDSTRIYRGGSGLGLNMTHELAVLMGGSIEVDSTPGKGSTFTINLPIVAPAAAEEPVFTPQAAQEVPKDLPEPADREKDLILVVEDNQDMQSYIRAVIGDEYLMASASDGEEGLEMAVELMPDIVISDVMMPRMDGLQMFARLKADERISHIPVILLTAIQDEQSIASSLKLGIDDYVTKPFSPDILLARIANILNRRAQMWEKKVYSTNPFVVKITGLINSRIKDSNLSLEYLAQSMNMSTTQLTRKTKSLMDTTPYSLIIKLRMEQAVRYLKEGNLNISEIAYNCGYQEVSNFSRAFTKFWGESPSQYLKKL